MSVINALKSDDSAAFREVFNECHHALYGYIIKKTQSEYLAEEIVQITFFKLWKYRHSLKEDIPILNQIFRIGRTTLLNELKKEKYTNKYADHLRHIGKDSYEHVTEQVIYNETELKLNTLIARLPPVRKRVFELSRFNYMSHKEISESLSLSPKTVENHINLALKFIKSFFILLLTLITGSV